MLTAALKHCEEKLDKLGENDSKRHKNYLQVISSLIKEGGQGKIGGLSEKFQNLQEMVTFISEKFEADKQEYLPSIDSKHSTNIVKITLFTIKLTSQLVYYFTFELDLQMEIIQCDSS